MKAVIYARYSSDNQREESIEGQVRECKDFALRKGYSIIKTYADRAISGKKAENRPQFMQMISDSKQKGFDTVLVWKIDRFSRDKYDSVFYKHALKKNDVNVVSATEPIDESPEGQLMESIFEGFSAYYIKDLAQKVSRGMTENALKGKYNGGIPTFGYVIDENKHFQPDPVKAPIVTDIFRRFACGDSAKEIVQSLKDIGLQTNQKCLPSYTFIVALLKNRRYLGEYRFKDVVIPNSFMPLTDEETFERCQKRLFANQRTPGHFKPVADKYVLTGKSFCGYCSSTIVGESGTSRENITYRYYHCRLAKKQKACEKKRDVKSFLEFGVLNCIMNVINDVEHVRQIVDNCYEAQLIKSPALPLLEKQLKQNAKEITNVMDAIKQGIVTTTTKETLLKLEQDKELMEIAIAKERIERPIMSKKAIQFRLDEFKSINLDDLKERQRLINVFLNSMYVYNDKMLVTLNIKDGEFCITFDEVKELLEKKNMGIPINFGVSSVESHGGRYRTRTYDPLRVKQVL